MKKKQFSYFYQFSLIEMAVLFYWGKGYYQHGWEINIRVVEKYLAAAYPQRSRGCVSLFQLSPHMLARPKKTLLMEIEGVQGKPLKQREGLWKVRRTGRLPLQHFSHFTDFTLCKQEKESVVQWL